MTDLSGQTVKGYEIRQCVGEGRYGTVYRAHQADVARDVAIKVIEPHVANQPDFIRRFEPEARRVAGLSHPHITPLYDYWRDPGGAYLVTRWFPENLQSALGAGPWSLRDTARLISQIGGALSLAHSRSLYHGNIKPSNVLLDEDQNAYLVDFACFWQLTPPDKAAHPAATLYVAPEQLTGGVLSPRTDIYGLGALLYRLLMAPTEPPAVTTASELPEMRHELIRRIQAARPELPAGLAAIIETAMAPDPWERYADAAQMTLAFDVALGDAHKPYAALEVLSERELAILRMMDDDLSTAQMAERLSLSAETVRWYAKRMYSKLDVHSRAQAIQRAQGLGLLRPVPGAARPASAPLPASAPPALPAIITAAPETNPYKGLRAFQEDDAADFFGREALTAQLVARLGEEGPYNRFLAVVGPSGSGKSSVVRAGLIPALKAGALPGSASWFFALIQPGSQPLEEVEIALTGVAVRPLPDMLHDLRRDERGLLRMARMALPKPDSQLFFAIDQFEEVFTLVARPTDRKHFLDSLYAAVTDPHSPLRILVTLRADFFDRPLTHEGFSDLLDKRTQVVGPLRAEELERAIVGPARRVGVVPEDGLATVISAEVNARPGALPLLQYALTELFERRESRQLTLRAFEEMKGVRGALARRAEQVYTALDEAGQKAAKQVFLRLVTLGEGVEDTRRRVALSELHGLGDVDAAQSAIEAFDRARLLTFDRDTAAHTPTVELAHEAILREWSRLRAWLDESRTDVRLQRLLATSAADWLAAARDPSYLLHGGRLALFKSWQQTTSIALTGDERAYLDASISHEQRQAALRRRLRNTALGVAVTVAVVMTVLAVLARIREVQAERQAAVNRSLVITNAALKLFESEGGFALPLALEAVSMQDPPVESVSALQRIAFGAGTRIILRGAGQGNAIKTVAYSPDGQQALSGGCAVLNAGVCSEGELILWDLRTGAELRHFEGHQGEVIAAAFGPDSFTIVSVADDGVLRKWNVQSGEVLEDLRGDGGRVSKAAISFDGKTVAVASSDGLVRIWDLEKGELRRTLDNGVDAVNLVAISGDGVLVAADAGSDIELWDATTGEELHRLIGHTDTPTAISIRSRGADGYSVLSSAQDTAFLEFDASTGELLNHTILMSDLFDIAVSRDGQAASLSAGFGPMLWDLELWAETKSVHDRLGKVEAASFSPDGTHILMGHASGMLRLVDMAVDTAIRRYESDIPLESIDVSSDGIHLVGGAYTGGEAVLFDVASGREIRRFPMPEDMVLARFSPDGRTLALGSANYFPSTREHTIRLVDVSSGEVLHELEGLVYHPRSMSFTPDGRYLLVGSLEWGTAFEGTGAGDLLQWDVQTGKLYRRYDEMRAVFGIVFSPDASQFVTMTDSQADPVRAKASYLTLWDLETGARIQRFWDWPDIGLASSAAWGLDATHVFVGGFGGIGNLDLETGVAPIAFRGLGQAATFGIDISPDRRYLGAGDVNQFPTFIVWDVATGREVLHETPYNVPLWDVKFSPDSRSVFTSPYGKGPIIQWRVGDLTLDQLLDWVKENRYVRELTCEERRYYTIPPLCEASAP